MSRTVTGYIDGRPQYRDEGPAVAHRQGFGGSAMGHFSGTVLQHAARRPKGTVPVEEAAAHRRRPA